MYISSIQALFIEQNMYTTIQMFGENYTFIQQGCIKLIKIDS